MRSRMRQAGLELRIQLSLEANGDVAANLIDLSVKESVLQFDVAGSVQVTYWCAGGVSRTLILATNCRLATGEWIQAGGGRTTKPVRAYCAKTGRWRSTMLLSHCGW